VVVVERVIEFCPTLGDADFASEKAEGGESITAIAGFFRGLLTRLLATDFFVLAPPRSLV